MLIPFDFDGQAVRVIADESGEPWFIARDVAEILGYSDAQAMTRRLDDDEKSNRQIVGLGSPTGGRGTTVISEAGLYSAILASTKPEAKPFKRWVTHEVLPTIRKTGAFSVPGAQSSPRLQAAAIDAAAMHGFMSLIGLDANAAAISANQAVMKVHGINLLELSGNTHLLASNQEAKALTATELGSLAGGLSAQTVNKLLSAAGLQAQAGKHWVPTEAARGLYRLLDTGKKHSDGTPVTQLKWYSNVLDQIKLAA